MSAFAIWWIIMEYVHLRQNLLVTCKTLVHVERKYMLGVFGIVENYSFDCDIVRGLDICVQLWYKDISASLREVIVHVDLWEVVALKEVKAQYRLERSTYIIVMS